MGDGGGSLRVSSARKIPKWAGNPLKGPLSAWLFCENHFKKKKTIITPLGWQSTYGTCQSAEGGLVQPERVYSMS